MNDNTEKLLEQIVLEKLKSMDNSEILPPLVLDGIERVIIITTDNKKRTLTITYSECLERTGGDKYKSPNYYKIEQITIPIQMLSWFAPRLDGYRSFLGVKNGYEEHDKRMVL